MASNLKHVHLMHQGACAVPRYHSDTQSMKIAQGVSGTVKDKGSAQRNIPFLMQAARQGFQV